ncbi:hypothetical protein SALBM311S_04115 [Streptomyces alboniger]
MLVPAQAARAASDNPADTRICTSSTGLGRPVRMVQAFHLASTAQRHVLSSTRVHHRLRFLARCGQVAGRKREETDYLATLGAKCFSLAS